MRLGFNASIEMSAFRRATDEFRNSTLPKIVEKANREGAVFAVAYARRHHEHENRTGDLVSPENLFMRIGKRTGRFVGFEVVNKAPYAWAVEAMGKPHVIEVKRASALVFKMTGGDRPGEFFVGQRVNWKGDRPYPFMVPAVDKGRAFTAARLSRAIPLALRSAWR